MNTDALLALIADLYAQLCEARAQIDREREQHRLAIEHLQRADSPGEPQ